MIVRPHNAGSYAQERYRRGLKAYRRRLRAPLLAVVVPMIVFFFAVAATHHLDAWSVAAGTVLASGVALFISTRDDAPQYVLNWGYGAAGERKTARAVRPLCREGWTVEHDIQRDGRANLDHVLQGPNGVFLLETKNLTGTITIENGVLTARQFDDPDVVYRHTALAPRLLGQAVELSNRLSAESGRRTWVEAVVVVWGHFPEQCVKHGKVTYLSGAALRAWLRNFGRR